MGIDDRPPSTESADASALETAGQPGASTKSRFGTRAQLALAFFLALAFSAITASTPYLAVALAFGPAVAQNLPESDTLLFFWLRRSFAAMFFLVFYMLGKRVDFHGQYLRLAVLCFAGVLVGELPHFVSLQTPSPGSSSITGFSLVGGSFDGYILVLSDALQSFAVPFAGLALAFVREDKLRGALWPPPSATGDRRLLSLRVVIVGFAIATAAYLASVLTSVIGVSPSQQGQSGFLNSILVPLASHSNYVFDFFYPLLFFIAFYLIGKRLDRIGGGMIAFSVSLFVAGALGYLVGNDLAYFVLVFALPGYPHSSPFGLPFLEDGMVQGLYVLAFGFTAASLGFVRNVKILPDHDRPAAAAAIQEANVIETA